MTPTFPLDIYDLESGDVVCPKDGGRYLFDGPSDKAGWFWMIAITNDDRRLFSARMTPTGINQLLQDGAKILPRASMRATVAKLSRRAASPREDVGALNA